MKTLFLILVSASIFSCQRSTEADLDQAVQTHIEAKSSAQAEDACQKVFIKALNESTKTPPCFASMCKTLQTAVNRRAFIFCRPRFAHRARQARDPDPSTFVGPPPRDHDGP